MFKQIISCGIIFIITISVIHGKLPTDIRPCKASDKVCLLDTINKMITTKPTGDPELNLISIDPLYIAEMKMSQPVDSPVNIDMVFRNNTVYGYKNLRAFKVHGFGENPEGKHEVYFRGSDISLLGDYTANGRLYLLPVRGEGRVNLTLDDSQIHIVITAGSAYKNGSLYMDVKKVHINFETSRIYFDFTNLYVGDKELSDELSDFINENWREFFAEIKTTLVGAFEITYTDLIRKVFESHPYSELIEGGN